MNNDVERRVLISHLYTFGEISWVLLPNFQFFNCWFFMYSRYKSLVRYTIWKCFLGICVLSFHFLDSVLWNTSFFFNFNSHFLFLLMLFVSYLKFLCKILFYEDFLLFFLLRGLYLCSYIHVFDPLWINFYKRCEIRVHFHSFACDYAVSVYHLLKSQLFSLNSLGIVFVEYQLTMSVGFILDSQVSSIDLYSCPGPVLQYTGYHCFVINFEIGRCVSPPALFFFQNSLFWLFWGFFAIS